jgi:hypothetical protein
MITHPNLLYIRSFYKIEDLQAYIKHTFGKVVFFHPIKPCHYKVFEDRMQGSVQLGTTQDLYVISQSDTNGEKCFILYRIVDIEPVRFKF